MRLLIDLRTGEPAIDIHGSLYEISPERIFNQYIDVLLHTQLFEEQLNPLWGLDIRGIFEVSSNPSWESLVTYMVAEALSKKREPLIDTVQSISVTKDNENRILNIDVSVQSSYGNIAKALVSINE